MRCIVRFAWLVLFSVFLLLSDLSCKNCNPLFVNEVWGTWRLVRVDSPTRTQTSFPDEHTLKIASAFDAARNQFDQETLFVNGKETGKNDWGSFDPDCPNLSFVAIYKDQPFLRKYWILDRSQGLRATGYVDKIGGPADTLTYFYERVR